MQMENFICEYADEVRTDTFGHKMLTGSGKMLENFVRNRFVGVKVRSIELKRKSALQRMLASATDIEEAVAAGREGIKASLNGATGIMIAFKRISDSPNQIQCVTVDVNEVCNKEKQFPSHWICDHGTNVTEDFLTYALPLIQGEPDRIYKGWQTPLPVPVLISGFCKKKTVSSFLTQNLLETAFFLFMMVFSQILFFSFIHYPFFPIRITCFVFILLFLFNK